MRAVLIDVYNKEIKEVTLDPSKNMLKQYHDHIKCDTMTVAHYINNHDSILVDDEGLLKSPKHFFHYEGGHQPFAGNGLILGLNREGETVKCNISLEEVKENVLFYSTYEMLGSMISGKF